MKLFVLLLAMLVVANCRQQQKGEIQYQQQHESLTGDQEVKQTNGDEGPPLAEYCQFESFNVSCPEGSVVLMERALYGRMSPGRCLKSDVSVGCYSDVLRDVDARCSGQPSCFVYIPDASLHQTLNCGSDMMAYLQASYRCLEVSKPMDEPPTTCDHRQPARFPAPATGFGYISSHWMRISKWPKCPLTINVPSGQRIDLYVLDFSSSPRYKTESDDRQRHQHQQTFRGPHQPSVAVEDQSISTQSRASQDHGGLLEYCHVYATLVEHEKSKDVTVCFGSARETHVHTSDSNSIMLSMSERVLDDRSIHFLIKYGVVGCPDFIPPKNAWIRRTSDQATITCNFTGLTWHLVCRGTNWIGQEATNQCEQSETAQEEGMYHSAVFPTYGLLTAVVTGVFIGAVCGFSLLGTVLWCKRRASQSRPHKECGIQMIQDHNLRIQGPPTEITEYDESGMYDPHYHHHHSHHHHHHPHQQQYLGEIYLGQHHQRPAQQNQQQQYQSGVNFQPPCKVHHRLENGEYGYTHVWEIAGNDGEVKNHEEASPESVVVSLPTYPASVYSGSRPSTAPILSASHDLNQESGNRPATSSFKPQNGNNSLYGKDLFPSSFLPVSSSSKVCITQSCSNPRSANYNFMKLSEPAHNNQTTADGILILQQQQQLKNYLEHPSLLQDHVVQKQNPPTGCCDNDQTVVPGGDGVDCEENWRQKDYFQVSDCCSSVQNSPANIKKLENHYT